MDYSIPTLGFGENGSIFEIITLGYQLFSSEETVILTFSVMIDQGIDLELIR